MTDKSKSCLETVFFINNWKYHSSLLFCDSLPVLTAATITRASSAIVNAINYQNSSNLSFVIGLNLAIAVIFGYVLGLIVMIKLNDSNSFNQYLHRLSIENSSFLWQTAVTLIIIKWIYNGENYFVAIGSWIAVVFIVILILYFSNLIRHIWFISHITNEVQENLIEFDSETFSLSIAFGLTMIIASAIYSNASPNYLSGIDDIQPIDDDNFNARIAEWCFILYAIFITAFIFWVESYELFDWKFSTQTITDEQFSSNSEQPESRYSVNDDFLEMPDASNTSVSADSIASSLKYNLNSKYSLKSFFSIFKQIDSFLFKWDSNQNLKRSYSQLFQTFRAYIVACAWYAWSILSFQVKVN